MIVIDANIALEILELRRFYEAVLKRLAQHQDEQIAVSSLTVSTAFYLAERHKIPLGRVETFFEPCKIFSVTDVDVLWALAHYRGNDFEDALQVAAAIREQCDLFLTLDAGIAKKHGELLNIMLIR